MVGPGAKVEDIKLRKAMPDNWGGLTSVEYGEQPHHDPSEGWTRPRSRKPTHQN